ncbi:unnamed protein product [Auanema sp. JU1783]|nr:unnamed protein product [Auanema sp. JU1783]
MAINVDPLANERWRDVRRLTDGPSGFTVEFFEPGPENMKAIHDMRVLVIGAGGLGCELLKNLALSGFRCIDVIDMDTIELSNLNRQFLFRDSDVGKSKAEVAARFIQNRVDGCQVTAHNCRIEDKDPDFYRQFQIVICGLDSILARRWINAMLCDLALMNDDGSVDMSTIIPMIDGGTEGFKGNARVIYPRLSPCVDCTLDLYPPQINFPLCTIANTPRLPEHCIEYVKVVIWPQEAPFEGAPLDADDMSHVTWVQRKATERAEKFGIRGVDRRLTQGVLKRIIPAVASTNAVIAASCALEALKLASNTAKPIDNYLNFADIEGIYCGVVKLEKDPNCVSCSFGSAPVECNPNDTLNDLIENLKKKYQLKNPSVETSQKKLYLISSFFPSLVEESKNNLSLLLSDLVMNGENILVADEVLQKSLTLRIIFL